MIKDRADYEFARDVVARHDARSAGARRCCSRRCTACSTRRQLAEWILEDRLPVRLQLQVHKYIWSAEARASE